MNKVSFNNFLKDMESNFTWYAAEALYNYLIQIENGMLDINYDPTIIKQNYAEYIDIDAVNKDYDYIHTIDELKYNTIVVEFTNGLIIKRF